MATIILMVMRGRRENEAWRKLIKETQSVRLLKLKLLKINRGLSEIFRTSNLNIKELFSNSNFNDYKRL